MVKRLHRRLKHAKTVTLETQGTRLAKPKALLASYPAPVLPNNHTLLPPLAQETIEVQQSHPTPSQLPHALAAGQLAWAFTAPLLLGLPLPLPLLMLKLLRL
jgi:hypothetical protein